MGFDIIVLLENSYINASKICEGGKKKFSLWLKNKEHLDLIHAFKYYDNIKQKSTKLNENISANGEKIVDAMIEINERKENGVYVEDINGVYIHPDLIPYVASWISPLCAIKVSQIMREYYAKEYKILADNQNISINFLKEKITNLENDKLMLEKRYEEEKIIRYYVELKLQKCLEDLSIKSYTNPPNIETEVEIKKITPPDEPNPISLQKIIVDDRIIYNNKKYFGVCAIYSLIKNSESFLVINTQTNNLILAENKLKKENKNIKRLLCLINVPVFNSFINIFKQKLKKNEISAIFVGNSKSFSLKNNEDIKNIKGLMIKIFEEKINKNITPPTN